VKVEVLVIGGLSLPFAQLDLFTQLRLFMGKPLRYLVPSEAELGRAICDVKDRYRIFGRNLLRDGESSTTWSQDGTAALSLCNDISARTGTLCRGTYAEVEVKARIPWMGAPVPRQF
jgi:hypothetical protein